MQRVATVERANWRALAHHLGFHFHTIDGEPYWDETAYYQFTLGQIENDIEKPTEELHQMCLDLVDRACRNEEILSQLCVPESAWDYVRASWLRRQPTLYGRMDFSYDGIGSAKFLEYNADTPTALYEAAFFQWVWLEQCIEQKRLPPHSDQYNSIQECLIDTMSLLGRDTTLHLACAGSSPEDRATVYYLEDCAVQAGLNTQFIYIDDVGVNLDGQFVDLHHRPIRQLFKLYPWEWMWQESFARNLAANRTSFIEPPWKSILSNKGILPLLWKFHPNHPNLLPAFFERDAPNFGNAGEWIVKPIYSREGSNIRAFVDGEMVEDIPGPYVDSENVVQMFARLPCFAERFALVGSWIVGNRACGLGIREDSTAITRDTSRFLPHIILD